MKVRIASIALALLLAAAAAGALVAAGVYNIAATEQHTAPVYWLAQYAMRQSVRQHSSGIDVPELGADRLQRGARLYRDHCLQCHGAPGVAPDEVGRGLTPAPANLVAAAREWPTRELYWVVRNGIKMTGMPAWAYRFSDEEMWDVVAFVQRLPALSPADYGRIAAGLPDPAGQDASTVPVQMHVGQSPEGAGVGNAEAGRRAMNQYLCATCHRIPGITGATADVGPTLEGMGSRKYIAGVLPNSPDNMRRWLRHPQQIDPLSAMPDLGVNDKDARDIAAYLEKLKADP